MHQKGSRSLENTYLTEVVFNNLLISISRHWKLTHFAQNYEAKMLPKRGVLGLTNCQKFRFSGIFGPQWSSDFPGASPLSGPPPGLYPGPAGGSDHPQTPSSLNVTPINDPKLVGMRFSSRLSDFQNSYSFEVRDTVFGSLPFSEFRRFGRFKRIRPSFSVLHCTKSLS